MLNLPHINKLDYSIKLQKQYMQEMGYEDGRVRFQNVGEYRGMSPPKHHINLSSEMRKAKNDLLRFMRVGIDIRDEEMKGPFLAVIQLAAPGGLTFVAQPTDKSGRLHDDLYHFFTDNRIVKVMIAAGGDRSALWNTYLLQHPDLDLTWRTYLLLARIEEAWDFECIGIRSNRDGNSVQRKL